MALFSPLVWSSWLKPNPFGIVLASILKVIVSPFLVASFHCRLCLNRSNAGKDGRSSLLPLGTYLRLLPVLNVNEWGSHARQKVKKALVYSIGQAEIFQSGQLLERILLFFLKPVFLFFPFTETSPSHRKIETVTETELWEAMALLFLCDVLSHTSHLFFLHFYFCFYFSEWLALLFRLGKGGIGSGVEKCGSSKGKSQQLREGCVCS